jgi:hypothetical protein
MLLKSAARRQPSAYSRTLPVLALSTAVYAALEHGWRPLDAHMLKRLGLEALVGITLGYTVRSCSQFEF